MFRVLLYIKILLSCYEIQLNDPPPLQVFFNEVGFPSPLVVDKGLFEFSKVFQELSSQFRMVFFYSQVM